MKRKILVFLSLVLLIIVARGYAQDRPNIIFLLTDDQRWDALGYAGNPIIQTPNLDRLAAEGIFFSNTFVTTSICAVSRASFFTGQYALNHGVNDFKTPIKGENLGDTYPMQLKKAGYQVGFIGKYGIGNEKSVPREDFDYFFGTAAQPIYENKDEEGKFIHYTDLVQQHILKFLEGIDPNRPFNLSVSFKAPHVQDGDPRQFIYAERYRNLYADITIPETSLHDPLLWERFPDFFRENNEGRKRWEIRFPDNEKYQESVRSYYRLITGVDDVVGRLVAELKAKGLDKNTIIVFSGDNGFYLGEYGLAGKWYGHERSIRVPLIIYDPRLKKKKQGQKKEQIALNIDVAPTILSMAGLSVPERMDGKNLVPLFNSKDKIEWRDRFYYEHNVPIQTIPKSQGFRTTRYKYLIYPESPGQYEELYDLEKDPDELVNLAVAEENKALLEEMRKEFRRIQQEVKK